VVGGDLHNVRVATETERKFLIEQLPEDVVHDGALQIRQGYLAEDGAVEVRLRITEERSVLTVKAGSGLSRTEVEVAIDPADADELWAHTAGRRIEKTRYRIPAGERVIEADVFHGELDGLRIAEVEFPDGESAAAFTPPEWFGRELTGDPAWSNASLSRRGAPAG
jgi:CYTH domain-containing protein